MSSTAKERLTQWAVYFVLLACFFLYFQEFKDRPYRQDEAWILGLAEEGNLLTMFDTISSTTLVQPGWFVILDAWISIFGSRETAGRALAHLFTLITLAVTYRIGRSVGGAEIGFYSALLLGTWPIFKFYSNELHYYSTFWLGCNLLIFGTMMWLKLLSPSYAAIAILGGGLAILSHLYAYYLIFALGIAALLVGQIRDRRFWLGFLTISISIGLIGCIWLGPNAYILLFSADQFEVFTANVLEFTSWQHVFDYLALNPSFSTILLVLVGFIVAIKLFLHGKGWDRVKLSYLIFTSLLFLLLVIVANLTIARQFHYRYLALILLLLAPIAAMALIRLEPATRIVLILIILAGMFGDERIFNGTGPYSEMIRFIDAHNVPDSRYIIDDSYFDIYTYNYYVSYRLESQINRNQIYFLTQHNSASVYPIHYGNTTVSSPSIISEEIIKFVGGADQVWRLVGTYGPANKSEEALAVFRQHYALHRQREWPIRDGIYGGIIEEYRRIPDDLRPIAQANELTLMHWQLELQTEAQPCQTIRLNSWWQASRRPRANYNLSLALVGQDGQGVSQHDDSLSPTLSRLWKPKAPYLDERALFIPCDLPAGTYPLVFALYDSETLLNATFTTPSGDPIGRNLFLTHITVGKTS